MRRFPYIYAVMAGLLVTAAPASLLAQQTPVSLAVRGSVQDDFIRVVFSGAGLPDASVDESQADTLRLTFNKAVNLTGVEAGLSGLSPAPKITVDGQTVTIVLPGLERHRDLKIGQRFLVDLFTKTPPKQAAAAAPVSAPAPVVAEPAQVAEPAAKPVAATSLIQDDKQAAVPDQPIPAPAVAETKTATVPPVVTPAVEAGAVPAVPVVPVEAVATALAPSGPVVTPLVAPKAGQPFTGSATITIGSTDGISIAVFERSGYLWIVTSRANMGVPPLVSGPSAALLGSIDAIDIEGGSAYRLKLPQGAYVRPEGGGLVWRLMVETTLPVLRGVSIDRDFGDMAAGPKMHVPLAGATGVLRLPDPMIGDDLAVVLVNRAGSRMVNKDSYVDFDMIPAIVGAVLRPKADGLSIAVLPQEVTVARQGGGLRMSAAGPGDGYQPKVVAADADPKAAADSKKTLSRMYSFKDWAQGGPKQYMDMRRGIDARVAAASEDRKLPEIISGAKFMLAQGLPQEATGFLQMAQNFMPLLRESAEFQSLRGAVFALSRQPDEALAAFQTPGLENIDEVSLWKAYALAQEGKVSDAQKMLPKGAMMSLLATYPERLQAMMLPDLIETVLSRGDVTLAENMIELYDKAADPAVYSDHDAAVAYFRGRAAQLRGDFAGADGFFREASEGVNGEYPVLATLTLVDRGLSAKTINREDAVRKLERFRFGWRGDQLESDVLEKLGMIYVTGGEQRRGLSILRGAATMAPTPEARENLVAVMQKAFRELFSGKTKEKMTAMESAAVAAEFSELMPAGGEGEQITMNIADQMVAVDLLDRAADMIEPMVERTEKAPDALRYAERAAGIRLLDRRPEEALRIIDKALSRPDVLEQKALAAKDIRSLSLLSARAKADLKRVDEAFADLKALPEGDDSLRLLADTAWKAQRWPEAADAFGKLIARANLDAIRPPTKDQAQMILNRALALNLASDQAQLDTLSVSYGDIMRRSELYRPFQLVTRTSREAQLADRDTLLNLVSEVDLFKDVLESYRTNDLKTAPAKSGQTDQKEKPVEATPKPAVDVAKEAATDAATKPEGEKPAAETKPTDTPKAAEH